MERRVFYSFHYANDVRRAAQIKNIGAIEGNRPVSPNEWEEVRRKGRTAIENWIDKNMERRTCLIVLIGEDTADRPWILYEIEHAWNKGMGVVGIYIHNIKDPLTGTCHKGQNPFEKFKIGILGRAFDNVVECYNPTSWDAYNDIAKNIEEWVEDAIRIRANNNWTISKK